MGNTLAGETLLKFKLIHPLHINHDANISIISPKNQMLDLRNITSLNFISLEAQQFLKFFMYTYFQNSK